MAEKTFSKKIQDIMGKNAPNELTGGLWRGKPYSHIYLDKKYNFIDGKYPEKCDVKGNFFKKFFEKQEWKIVTTSV